MLEKMHQETQLLTELTTSQCYILRAHIVKECYVEHTHAKILVNALECQVSLANGEVVDH